MPSSSHVPEGADAVVDVNEVEVVRDGQLLLRATSFSVARGEAVAITGPNGAGKTTLLRVLSGMLDATTGSALVDGRAVDERDPRFRRSVAALIGHPPVARDLTVTEHLALVGVSWGADAEESRARAPGLLERLGIDRLAARFPHELSSGQAQLFSLALALARPFEVLLLDEPEQRLDREHRLRLAGVLRGVMQTGATLVFSAHDAELIDSLGERTIALTPA